MPPKKRIYPVFLPQAGCPFQCVYCNQGAVARDFEQATGPAETAKLWIEAYSDKITASKEPGEIAFYGGTFTALPREIMESILRMAGRFVEAGVFTGIRFSTRPDCLDADVCDILSRYPVRTVELGVQSMSDRVLSASRRGYDSGAVVDAARQVKEHNWALGIQLMAGLPEDHLPAFLDSVHAVTAIRPDFVRIYPVLVLAGTRLAEWFSAGLYRPLNLDEAIEQVAGAYAVFVTAGIPVIRMGLHSDPALREPGVVLGGPHHPAFGYLVRCRWWRDRVNNALAEFQGVTGSEFELSVPSNLVSDAVGPGRSNIEHWKSVWQLRDVKILGQSALSGTNMSIVRH
jgi:histone acetyltransferase (RNA polymerase elongator complex component)